MSMTTDDPWERVLSTCNEIEAAMKGADPWPDPQRLAKIRGLCRDMKGSDQYVTEKASKIDEYAGWFFSARKHAAYPGGAAMLRAAIEFDLLGRIRQRVATRRGEESRR